MKVISLNKAVRPRNHVTIYAVVQSRSRGMKLNHLVVKRMRQWLCACEDYLMHNPRGGCDHIKAVRRAA